MRFLFSASELRRHAPLLRFTLSILLFSQLLAGGLYLGMNHRQLWFELRGTRTEATLAGVRADDSHGYRASFEYVFAGRPLRSTVSVANPPPVRIGEKLGLLVDPGRPSTILLPESGPRIPLSFLAAISAFFASLVVLFLLLGIVATSASSAPGPNVYTLLAAREREAPDGGEPSAAKAA